MFQETWVLQCYSCKIFQGHLKKKAKRWQCKVCGAKQDLMHVYFKGCPTDCRINIQRINFERGEKSTNLQEQFNHIHQNQNDDEFKSRLHNFQDENNISYNKLQNSFTETNKQAFNVTETYSEETTEIVDIKDTNNISNTCVMLETQLSNSNDNININMIDDCDNINSTDFTVKSVDNNINKHFNVEIPKLSIFESYNDFDETLDF